MSLATDARATYNRDGYYVAEQLIEHQLLDAYLREIDRILRSQLSHCGLPVGERAGLDAFYERLGTLHRHDQGLYLSTLVVFNRLKSLYGLFLSPCIADACARLGVALPLMHTLPLFHIISNRLKIAGGYHGFDAHQDWTGLQTSLNAITVWLPFHDVDHSRFPLEVSPGSHVQGLFPGHVENNDYQLDSSQLAGQVFRRVPMKKGDVIFLTPFTVHRTGLAEGDALRIAASWRYEDALEETFADRKYPFAQKRIVRHDLLFPDFPDVGHMRKLLGDGGRDGEF